MKAEVIIEMMLSGKYDHLTIGEFGKICKETIEWEINKQYDDEVEEIDINDEAYDKASSNAGVLI